VMLDNLISNAVRFTLPGGRVRVVLRGRGDEAEVAVIDTGVGIAPEELERIFDRFYQVEDPMTRRHGGMGLGLPIVKELVHLHGGRVWAESVPGQGSRFVVALPARVAPAEE
jgi:signal transduction histidine kinase